MLSKRAHEQARLHVIGRQTVPSEREAKTLCGRAENKVRGTETSTFARVEVGRPVSLAPEQPGCVWVTVVEQTLPACIDELGWATRPLPCLRTHHRVEQII
ncbi:MAG TPA: hypothetical protein VN815_10685, partial [Steroidobacteraceae bacterium]|nr:hypothetical protein [Steroidobacteraceae bacterium]